MLSNSDMSKKILDYFSQKYGQVVAPVGLLKLLSAISPFINNRLPCLNIFHVSPTRQFKTQTSIEAQKMISKKNFIDMPSDTTMNSLLEEYKNFGKRALFINDFTTLFATKNTRTRERLIGGCTNLLTEGEWSYGDKTTRVAKLTGFVSMIVNMTNESYNSYSSRLLGITFLERFLTVFYRMPEQDIRHFLEHKEEKMKIKWKGQIKFHKPEITNFDKYKLTLIDYAKRWSGLSVKSINGCFDQIESLMHAHLALNMRSRITQDELDLLKIIEPYLVDPFAPNSPRIIQLHRSGFSVKDICLILNKDPKQYKKQVYRILNKARERGVIQ
jgi:hypothetical protein